MDPFVRRLVQRLLDPSEPLSRNRHFHTFNTPEGRAALRIFRRLRSLQKDILIAAEEGLRARATSVVEPVPAPNEGAAARKMEVVLQKMQGKRTTLLPEVEFELLQALPGVREALDLRAGLRPMPLR